MSGFIIGRHEREGEQLSRSLSRRKGREPRSRSLSRRRKGGESRSSSRSRSRSRSLSGEKHNSGVNGTEKPKDILLRMREKFKKQEEKFEKEKKRKWTIEIVKPSNEELKGWRWGRIIP